MNDFKNTIAKLIAVPLYAFNNCFMPLLLRFKITLQSREVTLEKKREREKVNKFLLILCIYVLTDRDLKTQCLTLVYIPKFCKSNT